MTGIVHRDLKSLNLLLDLKWNVKVSDFGLTKFRDEMKKSRTKEVPGSIFWTAPEVIIILIQLIFKWLINPNV